MKIEKNSRQVPSIKSICSDKKYYDILYAYLQCISERSNNEEEDIRYIQKKNINFSKMSKIFNVSRQTISTKFKNLMELKLIELKNDKYIITLLPPNYAYLIPKETLELLANALSENSVSTYVYLFNRYLANDEKPFKFTLDQVKSWIGVSTKTRSNNNIITDILFVLKKIGLLEYHLVSEVDEESNFQNIKSMYQIDWVTNKVKVD